MGGNLTNKKKALYSVSATFFSFPDPRVHIRVS